VNEAGGPFALTVARDRHVTGFADVGATLARDEASDAAFPPYVVFGARTWIEGKRADAVAGYAGAPLTLTALGAPARRSSARHRPGSRIACRAASSYSRRSMPRPGRTITVKASPPACGCGFGVNPTRLPVKTLAESNFSPLSRASGEMILYRSERAGSRESPAGIITCRYHTNVCTAVSGTAHDGRSAEYTLLYSQRE
jgi:hypothetical protein